MDGFVNVTQRHDLNIAWPGRILVTH